MSGDRRRQERPQAPASASAGLARTASTNQGEHGPTGPGWPGLRWVGPVLIAVVAVSMAIQGWRTWPDVLIDFGRELYVPWRLSAGQVLYRDIAYFNGPLAPYWNALWFSVFGVGFTTLIAANLLLIGALTALLFLLLRDVGSAFGATMACLVFVTLFAFGEFLSVGNYSFVAPYSHDLTHGVLLSVIALFCVRLYQQHRQRMLAVGAGLAVGLLCLTKAEPLLAGAGATAAALGLTLWAEESTHGRRGTIVAAVVAAAIPPVVALLLFWLAMPVGQVLREGLGHWLAVFRTDVRSLPFYREGLGIDDVGASVRSLLIAAGCYAAILAPAAGLALAVRGAHRHRLALASGAFALVAAVLGLAWRHIPWQHLARPLPLFMLALLVAWGGVFVRRWRRAEVDGPLILRLALLVFALALLMKMALSARMYHYGFALAMPAVLLLLLALLDWAPALIDRFGGCGMIFRAAALAAVLVATLALLSVTDAQIRRRTFTVGTGADVLLTDARGRVVDKALEELRFRARPGQTLAVFPEGVMINYLSRLVNPTPYAVFLPVEISLFGEDRMLASLQAHPPDLVMLVHRETGEFGARYFGRDYARSLYTWIGRNYRPISIIGALPFQDGRFGMLLMKRHAAP